MNKVVYLEYMQFLCISCGLPQWPSGKEFAYHAGDAGDESSIPGSGRFPGGGHGNPLEYSYGEIPWTEGPGGLWSKVT